MCPDVGHAAAAQDQRLPHDPTGLTDGRRRDVVIATPSFAVGLLETTEQDAVHEGAVGSYKYAMSTKGLRFLPVLVLLRLCETAVLLWRERVSNPRPTCRCFNRRDFRTRCIDAFWRSWSARFEVAALRRTVAGARLSTLTMCGCEAPKCRTLSALATPWPNATNRPDSSARPPMPHHPNSLAVVFRISMSRLVRDLDRPQ